MKDLDFEPIKTTGQFLSNYKKHDLAVGKVVAYLQEKGFTVLNYGIDRRNERKWGDDTPDLLAWRDGYWLVFIDCKGHMENTWMLNRRAYNAYMGYSRHYQIPVVCVWVNLATGHIYYADIPFRSPIDEQMPHDGNKVIKTAIAQRIDKLVERLRMVSKQ